jgi:superfamily II DNA or RNA helicase
MAHLVPRPYQEEAAAAAAESNRIINLPTGSGKTLIASLVHEKLKSMLCYYN